MNYRTFVTYNVVGALCWATGVTTLGFVLGTKVPLVGTYLTPIVIAMVFVSLIPLAWDFIKKKPLEDVL